MRLEFTLLHSCFVEGIPFKIPSYQQSKKNLSKLFCMVLDFCGDKFLHLDPSSEISSSETRVVNLHDECDLNTKYQDGNDHELANEGDPDAQYRIAKSYELDSMIKWYHKAAVSWEGCSSLEKVCNEAHRKL